MNASPDNFKQRLRLEPPIVYEPTDQDTSGLDCLVHVIRHTSSLLDNPREIDDGTNPIVSYAWSDFNSSDPDPDARAHRIEAKQALVAKLSQVSKSLSFRDLVDSNLMQETLWSTPQWLAFDCKARLAPDSNDWEALPQPTRELQGFRSIIRFYLTLHSSWSLQDAIDAYFNPKRTPNQGLEVYLSGEPAFARVMYKSGPNPVPFKALQSFEIPVMRQDGFEKVPYLLNAVVRMRRSAAAHDYVRTYYSDGGPVATTSVQPSYMNNQWRVVDPDRQYMLFYSRGRSQSLCVHDEVLQGFVPAQSVRIPDALQHACEATCLPGEGSIKSTEPSRPPSPLPHGSQSTEQESQETAAEHLAAKKAKRNRKRRERERRQREREAAEGTARSGPPQHGSAETRY